MSRLLKFRENGKFSMLLFGDIHEKEDWKTSLRFKDMNKLMNAALDEFRPDICVLLGDNLSTGLLVEKKDAFDEALAAICAPAVERGIPVYAIMGNHEHDPGIDGEVLAAYGRAPGRDDAQRESGRKCGLQGNPLLLRRKDSSCLPVVPGFQQSVRRQKRFPLRRGSYGSDRMV